MDDTTIQNISGEENNYKKHYYGQLSEPTYRYKTELQKQNAE